MYDSWTLFAIEEGKFNYQIGEQAGEAGFADLVLCPPQTWFGRKVVEPLSFHFFHFDWSEPLVPFGEQEPVSSSKHSLEDTQRVSSTLRLLSPLERTAEERTQAGKQHLLNDLLFQAHSEGQARNRIPTHKQKEDPVMRWAMNRIIEHAYESLSMRGIANDLGITPVQLTRRFRSAYGQTPLEYLTDLRLRRASHLLEETSLSLERIAQQCGYENGFYLSRVFHKKKGVSPSLYRKMNQV